MKPHACRRCGARLRTHAELQEHVLTHPNVCVTCYRSFSRRVDLLAHKCKVEEFLLKFVNVLTVHKQNWHDIKEKRHVVIHYHRNRNVKNSCHLSRTWKCHHLSTNTVPNFKMLSYSTGVVSEHIRVTDQSSHATTSYL